MVREAVAAEGKFFKGKVSREKVEWGCGIQTSALAEIWTPYPLDMEKVSPMRLAHAWRVLPRVVGPSMV